jgi:hypothetical protein
MRKWPKGHKLQDKISQLANDDFPQLAVVAANQKD